MNTKYKDIPGFEGKYAISKEGDIWSYPKYHLKKGKILRKTMSHGYHNVGLYNSGKQKVIRVHRLVLSTYTPNIDNKPCINHKNGIKTDNRLENLEWCTVKENTIHAYQNGLIIIGEKHRASARKFCIETKSKPIIQLTKEGAIFKVYKSRSEAERMTGIIGTNISKCIYGKYKSCGGYKWKYLT